MAEILISRKENFSIPGLSAITSKLAGSAEKSAVSSAEKAAASSAEKAAASQAEKAAASQAEKTAAANAEKAAASSAEKGAAGAAEKKGLSTAQKAAIAAAGGAAAYAATRKAQLDGRVMTITGLSPGKADGDLHIQYTPDTQILVADTVTITGTTFDGDYQPTVADIASAIDITPTKMPTSMVAAGSMKLHTSTADRLNALASDAASTVTGAAGAAAKGAGEGLLKGLGLDKIWEQYSIYIMAVAALCAAVIAYKIFA